jgi:hypothetical protein
LGPPISSLLSGFWFPFEFSFFFGVVEVVEVEVDAEDFFSAASFLLAAAASAVLLAPEVESDCDDFRDEARSALREWTTFRICQASARGRAEGKGIVASSLESVFRSSVLCFSSLRCRAHFSFADSTKKKKLSLLSPLSRTLALARALSL